MDEKSTVALPAPPAWAIELQQRMVDSFASLRTDIGGLYNAHEALAARMGSVEGRLVLVEGNRPLTSERAKAIAVDTTSQADLQHESAIAQLVVDVAAIKAETHEQTATLKWLRDEFTALAKNPLVKHTASAVAGAIIAFCAYYAASHGGHP